MSEGEETAGGKVEAHNATKPLPDHWRRRPLIWVMSVGSALSLVLFLSYDGVKQEVVLPLLVIPPLTVAIDWQRLERGIRRTNGGSDSYRLLPVLPRPLKALVWLTLAFMAAGIAAAAYGANWPTFSLLIPPIFGLTAIAAALRPIRFSGDVESGTNIHAYRGGGLTWFLVFMAVATGALALLLVLYGLLVDLRLGHIP